MFFNINLFIVYFFSFFFNKLYFNIFKVLKKNIYIWPKLYSTYTVKKKLYYIFFLIILCIFTFCKIYWFIYFYILFIYKMLIKKYIDLIFNLKKIYNIFLVIVFWVYWFNLLIHLKVLSKKFKKAVDVDFVYYSLKWNCVYYYYYIIYVYKDLSTIVIWLIWQFINFQWYIFYLQIIFYLKNKKLECIYYSQLFFKGFLGIYCLSGIIAYIKDFNKSWKWKTKTTKKKNVSLISKVKFVYHRSIRITKEKFYNKVTKPKLIFSYYINNWIESVYFSLFKTGANSIIYYFYKIIKYSYSICVYIWKSDVIYRFLKFIERKKW